ncbi:hypothetical protein [Streptococcus suis]
MLGFISDNNIMHLKDFADYCMGLTWILSLKS